MEASARLRSWAPLLAVLLAVTLVVAANLVAQRWVEINWPVSLGTAVIVGGFLGLSLLGPKRPKPVATGFSIDS